MVPAQYLCVKTNSVVSAQCLWIDCQKLLA